ncbi:hypothetical protein C8039_20130 [Halogeometricum sp. wsp3]|nr:hypothetical protein C8039_20130 [Halogeometricum sp. wsp3]
MVQSGGGYDGVSRRSVLKASGTALTVGTVGLAGCSSSSGASVRPVMQTSDYHRHGIPGMRWRRMSPFTSQIKKPGIQWSTSEC